MTDKAAWVAFMASVLHDTDGRPSSVRACAACADEALEQLRTRFPAPDVAPALARLAALEQVVAADDCTRADVRLAVAALAGEIRGL